MSDTYDQGSLLGTSIVISEKDRTFLDNLPSSTIILKIVDSDYIIIYINQFLSSTLGYKKNETFPYDHFKDIVYSGDLPTVRSIFLHTISHGSFSDSYRLLSKEGDDVWMMGDHKYIRLNHEDYIFITYANIQKLMGANDTLRADNEKWTDIINSIPTQLAIFSIEKGQVQTISVNERLLEFANKIGYLIDGKIRNWSRSELMTIFNQNIYAFSVNDDIPNVNKMLKDSKSFPVTECIFRLRGSSEEHPIWIRSECCSKKISETKRNYYVSFADVTAAERNRRSLEDSHNLLFYMNQHDALTGVKNRNAYNDLIDKLKNGPIQNVGLAFADVNGLKEVNDSVGHKSGDVLICKFSNLLQNEFGQDEIYRISGDEFVLIQTNISGEEFRQRMRKLSSRIAIEHNIASIGYLWEPIVSDINQSVAKAEKLMYVEKQRYYASLEGNLRLHRPELLKELQDDIKDGRYQMFLQPKARIGSKQIIGAEALVRRFDANGVIVPPSEFVASFEKKRLIPIIDFFMLEEVCKLLKRWETEGREPIKLSTNMSRVTLAENNFYQHVTEITHRHDVDLDYLELEITESSETMNNDKLKIEIARLAADGFHISLDDMGTDYSALHMLLLDGVDTVKLDRSFVLYMHSQKGRQLLKHVIHMCHELGMTCLAEGVETDDVRVNLMKMGCDLYQGYLLSKPIPVDQFEKLL